MLPQTRKGDERRQNAAVSTTKQRVKWVVGAQIEGVLKHTFIVSTNKCGVKRIGFTKGSVKENGKRGVKEDWKCVSTLTWAKKTHGLTRCGQCRLTIKRRTLRLGETHTPSQ